MKVHLILFFCFLGMFPAISNAKEQLPLYELSTAWTDENGQSVRLKDFSGHPVIISMVYLTCQYLCPTIISEITEIEKKLPPTLRKNTSIVLLSFDPVRDTPAVMKEYKKKRNLGKQWKFLTGKNDSEIRELAVLLDFKYQKQDDGEFNHSFMILGLDDNGQIKARIDGANSDKAKFIKEFSK